jgi:hypothetical protein
VSLREFTVQGDGEASALVTTAVEMRGGAHQTRIRARPAYDTARAVGTRLMLSCRVRLENTVRSRTRARALCPYWSSRTRLWSSREHSTDPSSGSLSLTIFERSPSPAPAGVACGSVVAASSQCHKPLPGLYSTLKGYTLLSRATHSQGLPNLKGYSISRATHSQGGYSLSRGLLTLKGTIGCATAARSVVGRSTLSRATAARTTAAHSTSDRATADCCTANRSTANRSTADHSLDDRSSLNRPSLAPSTFALASARAHDRHYSRAVISLKGSPLRAPLFLEEL